MTADTKKIAAKIVNGFLSCYAKSHEMEMRYYICSKHLEELLDEAFGFPTNLRSVGKAKVIELLQERETK